VFNLVILILSCGSLFADIDIDKLLKKHSVPGAVVGKIDSGEINYFYHGIAKAKQKVDQYTIFQAASLSKTFFAAAFLIWAKEHKIELDSAALDFIPFLKKHFLDKDLEKITLYHLLTHSGGLKSINYPGYLIKESCPTLVSSLKGVPGSHSTFIYSGAGYTILQLIAETVSGKDFENFMSEYLFEKMNLENCTYMIENIDHEKLASPHNIFCNPCAERYFSEKAAAGLYCNVIDLAQFVKEIMEIRNQALLENMLNHFRSDYNLGLETEKIGINLHLAYHFGANNGWRSGLFFIPELKRGIVVLSNSDNGNSLICDIVQGWLSELHLNQPRFIRENFLCKKVTCYLSIVLCSLLFYRGIRFTYSAIRRKRRLLISQKKIYICSTLMFVFLSWIVVFFTPYSFPKGWIVASFMPEGFLIFSINLLLLIFEECLNGLFEKIGD